jgi:ribose 5-phosphate isomerase A
MLAAHMGPKQRAAEAAVTYVRSGTVIGLGTGSTADLFLIALADALRAGKLREVSGVPTSEKTAARARELGIPLRSLAEVAELDVDVDGADEVTPTLDAIKGLGGALLREKIVAQNARTLVIIADAAKRVEKLGTKSPLPVEVVPFEHQAHERFLRSLGCTPTLRTKPDGSTFLTDNGNYIYDCRFPGGIDDPPALARALADRAGIVESGLFLGMAKVALIADQSTVMTLTRP